MITARVCATDDDPQSPQQIQLTFTNAGVQLAKSNADAAYLVVGPVSVPASNKAGHSFVMRPDFLVSSSTAYPLTRLSIHCSNAPASIGLPK